MEWVICFLISIVLLLIPAARLIIDRAAGKRVYLTEAVRRFFLYFAVSVFVIMLPVCRQAVRIENMLPDGLSAFNYTVRNTFMVFSLDSDFLDFCEGIDQAGESVPLLYSWYGSLLFAIAPVLTFGVALSFIRKLLGKFLLMRTKNRKIYLFTGLNNQSCLLGESICEHEGRAVRIVYVETDSSNNLESGSPEDRAENIRATVLKEKLSLDEIVRLAERNEMCYFAMNNNESQNLEDALQLIEKLKESKCRKAGVYIFTEGGYQLELLGSAINDDDLARITDSKTGEPRIYIRRVNVIQEIVQNYFYKNDLFRNATELPDGTHKLTFAVVGFGLLGREVTKNLLSCLQMEDYDLNIHVFDKDTRAISGFKADCPELWKMNNCREQGESHYNLVFHESSNGGELSLEELERELLTIPDLSEIFVLLGDDSLNIETSMKLRVLLEREYKGQNIPIHSIVYDDAKSKLVENRKLRNYKGMDYNIDFIGRLSNVYTYEGLIESELIKMALERHLKWVNREDAYALHKAENQFYVFEYYFKSSVASVIRRQMRTRAGLPKAASEEERKHKNRVAEHMCWNAYMRCEGYSCGERNDMAKLHNDLVAFDRLPLKEQEKDDD